MSTRLSTRYFNSSHDKYTNVHFITRNFARNDSYSPLHDSIYFLSALQPIQIQYRLVPVNEHIARIPPDLDGGPPYFQWSTNQSPKKNAEHLIRISQSGNVKDIQMKILNELTN
jgi:hypothetical protein